MDAMDATATATATTTTSALPDAGPSTSTSKSRTKPSESLADRIVALQRRNAAAAASSSSAAPTASRRTTSRRTERERERERDDEFSRGPPMAPPPLPPQSRGPSRRDAGRYDEGDHRIDRVERGSEKPERGERDRDRERERERERERGERERVSTTSRRAGEARVNEFDRGPPGASTKKQLYNPSSPVVPRRVEHPPPTSPLPGAADNALERRQHRGGASHAARDAVAAGVVSANEAGPRRRLFDPDAIPPPTTPPPPPRVRRQPPPVPTEHERRLYDTDAPGPSSRKLFDPTLHDPVHFNSRPIEPTQHGAAAQTPALPHPSLAHPQPQPHLQHQPILANQTSSSRSFLRRPSPSVRTLEEQADREREKLRRREGSEREGQSSRRKDSDSKSKGSRSSEGSESFKDRERGRGDGDSGAKAYLRTWYKDICALEQNLTEMHRKMSADPEAGIAILFDPPVKKQQKQTGIDSDDSLAWAELVSMHKELADCHYNFLKLALDPKVPPGLRPLPVRYNIPVRLWQTGFHLLLERLRFAWMSHHPMALDMLTDFIYDAYQFYTELLEDHTLVNFRTAWIEALGDLARYRMAVASALEAPTRKRSGDARIDDDSDDNGAAMPSGASIGQEVADNWDVEDKETWRTTARDWYAMGITEKPGEGRLHHHLALLCRDVRGQESRALYHFAKSLTASHPFYTSRESILPLFDSSLQLQRSTPEATAMDLFVRLHGMLFTRIQLDDFDSVMSRFMERLEEDASLDGVSRKACVTQVDWLLMGTVNIAAVLQYGSEAGVIRKALAQEGAARRRQQTLEDVSGDGGEGDDGDADEGVVEDDEPIPGTATAVSDAPPPATFTRALELAFAVLDFVMAHPNRQQGIHQVLNPYLPIFLTFLATIFRQPTVGVSLIPHVPWRRLADFVNRLGVDVREESRLIGPVALPEDWAMRGMEWIGRRVYERGFWKGKPNARGSSGGPALPRIGERFQSEMDVLLADFDSSLDITEGVVDDVDGADLTDGPVAVNERRRRRVAWAAGVLVAHLDGFALDQDQGTGVALGTGHIVIRGPLAVTIDDVEAARAAERDEELRRAAARVSRERDLDEVDDVVGSDSEEDDPELAVLKERRRHLREVLNIPSARTARSVPSQTLTHVQVPRSKRVPRHAHNVVPGYTILIFDTNVLLSALSLFSRVVEGGQWSVIVPLPVVTELDGLSRNPPPLGTEAQAAVGYLEARIRTHALCLKIQTTRGNYLTDLLIRAENLDFQSGATTNSVSGQVNPETVSRTLDDLILNVASFQAQHFVNRSSLLGMSGVVEPGASQVLLVTFDRNLRLKARARGIDAADEREMASILGR